MSSERGRSERAGDRASETAKYANYFKVRMNPYELLMEFGQFHLEDREPVIHTQVVTTPSFGKLFLNLLTDSIHDFEAECGTIDLPNPSEKRE
jgi:Protein of unknown function (DUF3467).